VKLLKNQWKRGLTLAMVAMLTVGLVTGCGATPKPSENKTINIGYVSWAEDIAVTNLWKVVLEEKGYQVNITMLDVAPLFVGLDKGDIDLFMDSWLPVTHKAYMEKYKDSLDDYGTWYEGEAKIGLVVPSYVDINSIKDLKGRESEFNGEIIGIDPGASIMVTTDKLVETLGINYQVVKSSEAGMLTALDKAYRAKEAIAITGWSPHWMFAKYDLKYLEDPQKTYGEAEGIHTIANKEFTKNNPEVADMVKAFKLSDKQVGNLEGLINDGMDPYDAAKKWSKDNKGVVDSWVK